MFSKKSNKANSKNQDSQPKGALLTPPENLYIPESHFIPETQYVQDGQALPDQQQQQQQLQPQHQQQQHFIPDQVYAPPDPCYMPPESAYLTQDPNYYPMEQPQINPMPEPINVPPNMTMNMNAPHFQRVGHPNQPQMKSSENSQLQQKSSIVYPIDFANVKILFDGYSKFVDGDYFANCTCTLIKGGPNIVIDTMTVWDEEKLIRALRSEGLSCEDIDFVICTHGHSDHTGCNHLFKNAIHIVGFSISHKDQYYLHPDFRHGEEFNIDPSTNAIKIIPTPGHTLQDVTVLVYTSVGALAIAGDLFEKAEDLENEYEWLQAGSDNASLQRRNRQKILELADYIIPGHGPIFKVPERFKKSTDKVSMNQ